MTTHALGDVNGQSITASLTHSDSIRCPMCPKEPELVTACGCSLEPGPCLMHRTDRHEHRHCMTCGVPAFVLDEDEVGGTVEFDDHQCPPGFIGIGRGACEGL